jgi:small subunit ribosomal protein S16
MSVRIRLQRRGRKKRPFYHIVVADERSPRDGRFIEKLGTYNPMTEPATIELDNDRAFDWLMKGAQPSDTAKAILRYKGVLYKKHLQRGVIKGALTQEQADEMYAQWITDKENKIRDHVNETAKKKAEFYSALSGTAAPIEVKEEEVVETAAEAEAEAPAAEAEGAEEQAAEAPEAEAKAEEAAPAEQEKEAEPETEAAAEEAAPESTEEPKEEEQKAEAPAEEPEAQAEEAAPEAEAADEAKKEEGAEEEE